MKHICKYTWCIFRCRRGIVPFENNYNNKLVQKVHRENIKIQKEINKTQIVPKQ